jgi:hypothetical protein
MDVTTAKLLVLAAAVVATVLAVRGIRSRSEPGTAVRDRWMALAVTGGILSPSLTVHRHTTPPPTS